MKSHQTCCIPPKWSKPNKWLKSMNSGRDVSKPLPTNFPRAEGRWTTGTTFLWCSLPVEQRNVQKQTWTFVRVYIHIYIVAVCHPILLYVCLGFLVASKKHRLSAQSPFWTGHFDTNPYATTLPTPKPSLRFQNRLAKQQVTKPFLCQRSKPTPNKLLESMNPGK